MNYYKDTENKLHAIDSDGFEHFLPNNSVKITEEEYRTLSAPSAGEVAAARVNEIHAELATIDQKRIRPLAESDNEYLAGLNAQAKALREELRGL